MARLGKANRTKAGSRKKAGKAVATKSARLAPVNATRRRKRAAAKTFNHDQIPNSRLQRSGTSTVEPVPALPLFWPYEVMRAMWWGPRRQLTTSK